MKRNPDVPMLSAPVFRFSVISTRSRLSKLNISASLHPIASAKVKAWWAELPGLKYSLPVSDGQSVASAFGVVS